MPAPIVVVGGGLAAARAVATLQDEGHDGDVVVLTSERHRPYERPPLSKDYLRGEVARSALYPLPEEWYGQHGVDLRPGMAALGLHPGDHTVTLSDGSTLRYSRLLLATGSTPRHLSVPGGDLRGLHYLRTIDDADHLAGMLLPAALEGGDPVAVVGDGWIGLEVAASARELGLDVTLLGRGSHPLGRLVGPELGEVFARLHEQRGVRVHRRAPVTAFTHSEGQVTGVVTADGSHVEAAVVVVGIGAVPAVGLAAAAGLELRPATQGGGVAVDGSLRTSHPDVFAAGDIASVPSPQFGRPLRHEHWAGADTTGRHAARAMLGATDAFDALPYFFTDQYDLGMEAVGWIEGPGGYDDVVVSGSLDEREAVAFWRRGGAVQMAMALNTWDRMPDAEELIRSRREVPREELEAFRG